jgi:hypothetical protein
VFNKIDINSISVRKFNLDVCEDPNQLEFEKPIIENIKRVCLPIFTQDILESLNCLDIGSSAGKSQYNVNQHDLQLPECLPVNIYSFESAKKEKQDAEITDCQDNSVTKMSIVSSSSKSDILIHTLL